ncbi:Type I secretion system membrane fusion protein PrsE [Pseudovibrio axinellae]|uniref:Membrane fusion protein (MFP) family protein n=1 Tax=Pseudovibrio axinellae TaxID=989403 RepID=A0A165VSC0_9HYPH|nr:HlyD family type I secretion periplasmic adaptor subunit [Pseudovibrio axinellae]KZL15370.1 Type I secretion system membrane fusion protein PrsE [Pseudovibrio axinellae]SER53640.1 HlyD family secretion protein [Pseudovibrio axinellae]
MVKKERGPYDISASIGRHLRVAGYLAVVLVLGAGSWSVISEISGAVVAPARIVVETSTKSVQHRDGGIIEQILVRNGDPVKAGDLVLKLDDTLTRANLAVLTHQLDELYAREARLLAEIRGDGDIQFKQNGASQGPSANQLSVQSTQRNMLEARQKNHLSKKEQLKAQIGQFEKQIVGMMRQQQAKQVEVELIDAELAGLESLRKKKLVTASRVMAFQRERSALEGELGAIIADIARTQEAISERRLMILQTDEELRSANLDELGQARAHIAELEERRIAAKDELRRTQIRAPQDGKVFDLAVHTIGGVIMGGDVVLKIVPQEDQLIVEAKIKPVDVDQINPDQDATIRLPAFDRRTTPELKARLKTISPDLVYDPRTGNPYYLAELSIAEEELERLEGKTLIPGMPVEAFITTENRSVLSYLVKPVMDQIAHAMRES